ncbi:hypothetical protein BV25DRAFT_1777679, partial [Artomyces pyxidatus]
QPPITLTKRLLFPHLHPSAPIPPLLPSGSPALNTELYDFIALSLRAYVTPWWSRLTRYDKQFLPEITRVLTAVLRVLEARARATDFSPLVYRDLPAALAQHYADYRSAARRQGSSYAAGGTAGLAQLFHAQQQHIGVSPEGVLEEVYVRTAIDAVLKVCLPEEDWEAEPERYIVREIVVRLVCVDIVPKITQPWFVYKSILDLLGPEQEPLKVYGSPVRRSSHFTLPSLHTLLVLFLSTVQTISSTALALIHGYKQAVQTIKTVNSSHASSASQRDVPPVHPDPASPVSDSSPTFPTPAPSSSGSVTTPASSPPISRAPSAEPKLSHPALHDLARPAIGLLAEIFTLRARFASAAFLALLSMLASVFSPFLDRLLPHLLYASFLSSQNITNVLGAGKRALFPNGYPGSAPPDLTPEEQAALCAALARRIASGIPGPLAPLLLGPNPGRTLAAVLDPLGSQACNAHLFMVIFDLVLLTLFPEMAV